MVYRGMCVTIVQFSFSNVYSTVMLPHSVVYYVYELYTNLCINCVCVCRNDACMSAFDQDQKWLFLYAQLNTVDVKEFPIHIVFLF